MALKLNEFRAARDRAQEVINKLERNEGENKDFALLRKIYKEEYAEDEDAEDGVGWRVVLHLLNRLRRLEQRVRDLEGD